MRWITKNQYITLMFSLFLFSSLGQANSVLPDNPGTKSESAIYFDTDLVLVNITNAAGTWNPLPATTIPLGEQSQGIFNQNGTADLDGSFTYCLAEYVENGSCTEKFQVTLTIQDGTCAVTNGSYLTVSLPEPTLVDGVLTCNLYATFQPMPNSPQISVAVANQIGRAPGTEEYTYALQESTTQVVQGMFKGEPSDIPSNNSGAPIVLTALEGAGSYYQGKIIYGIDDALVSGAPTGLEIDIKNINGSPECNVAITGWNEGERIYSVSKNLTGSTNASCAVTVTSTDNPNPPVDYEFNTVGGLATNGVTQIEYFQISGVNYLLASNYGAVSSMNNLFRFNSSSNTFDGFQAVIGRTCYYGNNYSYLRDHAIAWHHFKVGSQDWFAMANNYSTAADSAGNECFPNNAQQWLTNSYMFQWDYNANQVSTKNSMSAVTDSALMWKSYSVSGRHFVVVAEAYKAGTEVLSVYEAKDNKLSLIQKETGASALKSPNHIEVFTSNSQLYLVISQVGAGNDTLVYTAGADGKLTLYQGATITPTNTINPAGYTNKSLVFTINGQTYLAQGYASNQSNVVPEIYQWQATSTCGGCYLFVPITNQELPASFANVQGWVHYNVNGRDFLAAAMGNNGVSAYRWNPQLGELETGFSYEVWNAGDNIVGLTPFFMNGYQYLALAKKADSNQNMQTTSPILRWEQVTK